MTCACSTHSNGLCQGSPESRLRALLQWETLLFLLLSPAVNSGEFLSPFPVPGHDWLRCTLPLFLVLWEKRDLCIPSLNAPNINGLHTLRANLGIQQIYDFSGKMHSVLQAPSLTWREVTWGRLWGQQPPFLWDETGCLTQALVGLVGNWSLAFFGFVSPYVASVCSEGFSHWFCSSQGDWGCLARDGLIVFSLRELRCLISTFIIPTSSLSCAV